MGVVLMSKRELSRIDVLARIDGGRLTSLAAADLMRVTQRQTQRLLKRYRDGGAPAIANRRRGRPSNNRLSDVVRDHAIALVREHFADFGPKLAAEKLAERHDLRMSRETLRGWMRQSWVACARSEPRALSSLGGGKGYGCGAEGVGPSHRKEGNGELGKGFGAKAITYWTAGEAAEEGEGDQDAGSKPGRGSDADRGRMGSERHSIREREERKERRAHGPRSRPGKQQVDQHGRARLPHQRARDARDGPGGEIEAGAHRKRRRVLALAVLTRPAARDRHQYGEAKDHRPGGRPHQERSGITEGDEAERQPNETEIGRASCRERV